MKLTRSKNKNANIWAKQKWSVPKLVQYAHRINAFFNNKLIKLWTLFWFEDNEDTGTVNKWIEKKTYINKLYMNIFTQLYIIAIHEWN